MAVSALDTRGLELLVPAVAGELPTPSDALVVVGGRGWSRSEGRSAGRPLSPRERQILTLIIDGKSRKEVAYDLAIAHSTVRVIYSRAMKKLGSQWHPLGRRP